MIPKRLKNKAKRRKTLRERRRHKPFASKRKPNGFGVIPIRDKCFKCGKNVTNHHFACNSCWKKLKEKQCQ